MASPPTSPQPKTEPKAKRTLQDDRGKGFPQILHERARKGAEELMRVLISLSTASVAVFFIALTGKIDPPLTSPQRVSVLVALLAMSAAAMAGLFCWYADSRRNYHWGSALQSEERQERDVLYRARDRWLFWEKLSARLQKVSFGLGILAAVVYLVLRILG